MTTGVRRKSCCCQEQGGVPSRSACKLLRSQSSQSRLAKCMFPKSFGSYRVCSQSRLATCMCGKKIGWEPGHIRDTRDTRAHTGTRITHRRNLTTIQTHQHTRARQRDDQIRGRLNSSSTAAAPRSQPLPTRPTQMSPTLRQLPCEPDKNVLCQTGVVWHNNHVTR